MSNGSSVRETYSTTHWMLERRGFQVATVIDVGAAEGAYFLLRLQHGLFMRARHFFIDAMQENEEVYRKLAPKFGVGYEIAALAAMEGEVDLRIDPGFYNTHIDRLQPNAGYEKTRRVRLSTLDGVVAKHALEPPFAIKIDVQGAELDVLRGALRTLEESTVVTVESQIFSPRDSLTDLLAFMAGNGWTLYDVTNLGHYPSDGTLYQCYATFIPKSMDFRAGIEWTAPEQRAAVVEGLAARRRSYLNAMDELLKK